MRNLVGWMALVTVSAACEAASGGAAVDAVGGGVDSGAIGDAGADVAGDVVVDTAGDAAKDAPGDSVVGDSLGTTATPTDAAVADGVADTAPDIGKPDASVADAAVADATVGDATVGDATGVTDLMSDTSKCPSPQPPNTVCEGSNWACAPGFFHYYGKTECVAATCENLAKAKSVAIDEAVMASQKCSGGDEGECIVVPTSTDCGGTCGAAVNVGMQNDVLKVVGWVDDNLCKKYGYKDKCGYSTPKCQAPKPMCGKGMCWYVAP